MFGLTDETTGQESGCVGAAVLQERLEAAELETFHTCEVCRPAGEAAGG
jgi:hypothetical protein